MREMDESIHMNTRLERAIRAAFPDEVGHVWSRIGTAEIATDPMGIELTDMFMTLKPRKQWTKAHTQVELTTHMCIERRQPDAERIREPRHRQRRGTVPVHDLDGSCKDGAPIQAESSSHRDRE